MANKVIDAFGHIVAEEQNAISVEGGDGLLDQWTVELDKENGSTHPVKGDPISIPELVASYEDQCGMEWARRMLRSGQLTAADLADDGKHGGDYTGSTELNVAYRQAQAAKARGDKVAAAIGATNYMTEQDLDAYVKAKVAEALAAAQKAPAPEGESK